MEDMVNLSYFNNKKVFITGHTGFKGSWLSYILDSSGALVKGYSLKPNTKPSLYTRLTFSNKFSSSIGDIRDYDLLEREVKNFQPDLIFHLAAQPIVLESYNSPRYTNEVNFNGTLNLLEIIRKNLTNTISIFITTDKVYQNFDKEINFKEDDRLGGVDPYSSSKAASELLINSYYKSFFKNTKNMIASARAGNVIGGGDWSKYRLFPDIIRSCFEENILEIRNPNSVRPWQHVLDPLFGYLSLAEKLSSGESKYCDGWNFGPETNVNTSVKEIIEIIKSKGLNLKVKSPKKVYKEESKYLMLDIAKAKNNLDWQPKWDTKESIYKTIDWYQKFYANINVNQLMKENIKEYINT